MDGWKLKRDGIDLTRRRQISLWSETATERGADTRMGGNNFSS